MTERTRRRAPRLALRAAALASLVLLLLPAGGWAHALVISATPQPGAQLHRAPAVIAVTFSEPINRPLSSLALETTAGRRIPAGLAATGPTRLELQPLRRLGRGAYRVQWHSVSADDGHTANGSYAFSLDTPLTGGPGGAAATSSGGVGWPALLLRSGFDGALIVFCGGLFCSALLAPAGMPGGWLFPSGRFDRDAARVWRLTVKAGVLAAGLSAAVALHDTAAAGGGLSARSVHAYLLADVAGQARLAVVLALLLSVLMALRRAPARAGVWAVVALAALVVGGHARSAHPAGVAITSDVVHLAAASVWIGGVVHVTAAWLPKLAAVSLTERRQVLAVVLPRFGRLALGAFVVLVLAGLVTAATELPSLSALWTEGYGRALMVKAGLVASIAVLGYVHAYRLRPRILAKGGRERGHWGLMAAEPVIGAGVIVAAAWLVASGPSSAVASASRRPQPPTAPLSVAEQAGPYIVHALVSHRARGVSVKVQTLTLLERPARTAVHVIGAARERACGPGCVEVVLAQAPRALAVEVPSAGRTYRASVPIRFRPGSAQLAGRLITEVARSSRRLTSVAIREALSSGSGAPELTDYRVSAPNGFAYELARGGRRISDAIIVGTREWIREGEQRRWKGSRYGGGAAPFSASAIPQLVDAIRRPRAAPRPLTPRTAMTRRTSPRPARSRALARCGCGFGSTSGTIESCASA